MPTRVLRTFASASACQNDAGQPSPFHKPVEARACLMKRRAHSAHLFGMLGSPLQGLSFHFHRGHD